MHIFTSSAKPVVDEATLISLIKTFHRQEIDKGKQSTHLSLSVNAEKLDLIQLQDLI